MAARAALEKIRADLTIDLLIVFFALRFISPPKMSFRILRNACWQLYLPALEKRLTGPAKNLRNT
jgi:hypothetical protein